MFSIDQQFKDMMLENGFSQLTIMYYDKYRTHYSASDKKGQDVVITRVTCKDSKIAEEILNDLLVQEAFGKNVSMPNLLKKRIMYLNKFDTTSHNEKNSNNEFDVTFVTDRMPIKLKYAMFTTQLTEQHAKFIIYQLLCSLHVMHDNDIIHQQLSPDHILINEKGEIKITLGSCTRLSHLEETKHELPVYNVTPYLNYESPEILLNFPQYDTKPSDMWSVGCILAEILGNKILFKGSGHVNQFITIFKICGTPSSQDLLDMGHIDKNTSHYLKGLSAYTPMDFKDLLPNASPEAIDLLNQLLILSPEKRIKVKQALSHPFFKQLYDSNDVTDKKVILQLDYDKGGDLKYFIDKINECVKRYFK